MLDCLAYFINYGRYPLKKIYEWFDLRIIKIEFSGMFFFFCIAFRHDAKELTVLIAGSKLDCIILYSLINSSVKNWILIKICFSTFSYKL